MLFMPLRGDICGDAQQDEASRTDEAHLLDGLPRENASR